MDLNDILKRSWNESEQRRLKTSLKSLKSRIRDLPSTLGFARRIAEQPFSVIAEIKTKSPSMGPMRPILAEKVANEVHLIYQAHPVVSAISVLTQESDFGGTEARLRLVRRQTRKPILRKDFIRDDYEVYFSRAIGADAILLMANVVTDRHQFAHLHSLAAELNLDVLCEVHSEDELEVIPPSAKIYGINSRKFKSSRAFFLSKLARHGGKDATTDLAAFELYDKLPPSTLKIAESGITSRNLGGVLRRYPFNAALIGTSLLKGDTREELNRLREAIDAAMASNELHPGARQPGLAFAHG